MGREKRRERFSRFDWERDGRIDSRSESCDSLLLQDLPALLQV